MATYPPNQTTPTRGSGNYVWNWLGSSLKKFGAAISPYVTGGDPYKKYVALLTQTDIDPPVATVLENTLGETPIWTYASIGLYKATFTTVTFDQNKTLTNCSQTDGNSSGMAAIYVTPPSEIILVTYNPTLGSSNDVLYYSMVEIRVYP